MSHVAKIQVVIKDLKALKAACAQIGLELVEGQKQYAWYGKHVGDYPLPEGFTAADLGKCDHAIRVIKQPLRPDGTAHYRSAYEVGVVKNKDSEGYTLLWDFWAGGYGLQEAIGDEAKKLR
jgi:hypothetical protein